MAAKLQTHEQGTGATCAPLITPVGPWVHGVAGILGGSISMALFYPLDFLRTRRHLYKGGGNFSLRSARQILREEGLRGMYSGLTVSMFSYSVAWGLYLLTFRTAQQKLFCFEDKTHSTTENTRSGSSNALRDFLSACVASVITGVVITPMNLLKTRRQLHEMKSYDKPRGVFSGIRSIIKKEGYSSLIRAVGPQILLTGSTTIQVSLYEGMKHGVFLDETHPLLMEVVVASALSKATASAVCNPLEVVRTRLQDVRHRSVKGYNSMWGAFCTIWRTEGFCGLYRGLPVNICRVIPTTVMTVVVYEEVILALSSSAHWEIKFLLNKTVFDSDLGDWIDISPRE
ncbi:mitochondrial carrier protein [Trypanosoma rangeli SC58]|uniref:Mitochondrial carrier protein n=1 Tax=Trypanosoma rangeli SC58 TaxID=429131 RepID=A0A061IS76_TRYRA|nr:mitochondrial carrier protein [Trypanosoma rangeli SC58]ESL11648.1 mitochondrial carrier protein [Trypanosoma rangeli SC58]